MVCRPFCVYYKPGKNEQLLCRGALVVERLRNAGRKLNAAQNSLCVPSQETIEIAVRHLCGACGFREKDCDFAQDRQAKPCGGFVILSGLLDSKTISAEDMA